METAMVSVAKDKYEAMCELTGHIVAIKGIVSKGRRKGSPYHLTAINRDDQFSSMLFKTAESAGVEIVDLTKDEE